MFQVRIDRGFPFSHRRGHIIPQQRRRERRADIADLSEILPCIPTLSDDPPHGSHISVGDVDSMLLQLSPGPAAPELCSADDQSGKTID